MHGGVSYCAEMDKETKKGWGLRWNTHSYMQFLGGTPEERKRDN